jgi:hypothetical protein
MEARVVVSDTTGCKIHTETEVDAPPADASIETADSEADVVLSWRIESLTR